MKRTAKILFSAMLVLMFVFQFGGAMPTVAKAANTESTLSAQFYVWVEGEGDAEGSYQPYESADTPVSASFGNEEAEEAVVADMETNGVSFNVPEGLYVESIRILGTDAAESDALDLTKYAVIDGSTVGIPASAFEKDPELLKDAGTYRSYVLRVCFKAIDPEAEAKITYTDGELNNTLGTLVENGNDFVAENYTVLPLSDSKKAEAVRNNCKEFAGWRLVYANGLSQNVSVDETIDPYMDAKLVAQWKDVIVVVVGNDSKTYDGTPLEAGYNVYGDDILADGQKVSVTLDNSSITDAGSITCTPTANVTDAEGNSVDGYTIHTYPGTLTVNKASIRITSPSGEKVYDGQPLTGTELTIDGSAVGNDVLNATASGTITDAGSVENTVSYTITKEDGTDNSANYDISVTAGTLTVTKRTVTVTTSDAAADYTGAALTKNEYSIDGLVDGHKETVTITGSQTLPGSSENTAEVKIADANGNDVSGNYDIQVVPGTLTVNPLTEANRIPLTIAPKAVSKGYDGTALTASEYEIKSGTLPEGVTLEVTYSGEQINAGTGESSIASVKVMQNDQDVTANYTVSTEKGKLTVDPRPITLTADSAKKEYDGKALTKNSFSYDSSALVSGHKVAAEVTGTQTEVGSSKNTVKKDSVKITDANGADVTKNYTIDLKEGTLEVTGKAITDVTVTASASKVYDGTALTLTEKDIKVTPALPSGYTVTASFSVSSRTDAGKDEVTLTNVVIKDASGTAVTAKYNVKVEKGTLEVTARPLTITTADKSKVYDGKALTDKRVPTIDGQLKQHNMKLEFTGTQTKVGSSENSVKVLSIYDKDTSADVTKNYSITYKFGKLTVTSANGSTTNNNNTTDGTPKTGDTNNIWIWIALMVVAVAAAVVVVLYVRKNKKKGEDQTK